MRFRNNDEQNLATPFHLGTGFDQLLKAWPADGVPINDPSRYPEDEKLLIPLTGQTIRASLFNSMSDALLGIQYNIKNNAGKTYQIAEDGSYTLCSSLSPLISLISLFDVDYINTSNRLAYDSTSVTATLNAGGTGYTFQTTVDVPATIGSLASSNNVAVFLSAKIKDPGAQGVWYNKTGNVTDLVNDTRYISISSCPDIADPTILNVYGQVITNGGIVNSASGEYSWNNYITSTQTLQQILADTTTKFAGFSYKALHPLFENKFSTLPESLSPHAARTGSLRRTIINGSLDWVGAKSTTSSIYPYKDTALERGISGGILIRDRNKTPDPFPNPQDVYIDFMFHGFDWTNHANDTLPGYGGYLTRSGVFLRMYRNTNPSDWPASIDINLSGNYDYRNHAWYQGYLLRFAAERIEPSDFSDANLGTKVGSWAIMKVQYEQFGATHAGDDSAQYWWPNLFTGGARPTTGVVNFNSNTPEYDDAPPGRFTVLAYNPPGEEFIPVIDRNSSRQPIDNNDRYMYRFEVEGNVIRVKKRLASVSTWTTVLSVTDTSPLVAPSNSTYYPSGLYGAGYWGRQSGNSGRNGWGGIISLSNINEGVIYDSTASKTIDIDCLFFKIPGQDSSPTLS